MIITISGKAGSGKSTIAKLVAKKLKLKHYSTGDFMRELAKEKGISLLELSKLAEKDSSIDKELDDRQMKLGKQEDNFVIDGRLSAHFIPHADFKIFLDCDLKTRAIRIYKNIREDEKYSSLIEAINKIKKREISEIKRYKKYYNINPYDKKNYNVVVKTTNLSINEVVEKIMQRIGR